MKKKCPECSELFSGYKCECGYRLQSQPKSYAPCDRCNGVGFVCAWQTGITKSGKEIRDYKAFKCNCSNAPTVDVVWSDGSKKLAVWGEYLTYEGWKK